MRYRWIDSINGFKEIAMEWDAAVDASPRHNPFLYSDFIAAWWKEFGSDAKVRVLEVRRDGALVGGLPLSLKAGDGAYRFARILSVVGGVASSYTEPLYASGDVRLLPVIMDALKDSADWDALCLPDVRDECGLLAEIGSGLGPSGVRCWTARDHENLAMDLSRGSDPVFQRMTGKLRRDLRAKRKHLTDRCGDVELKEIRGRSDIAARFDIYARFSTAAFQNRGRKSSFSDQRYAAFMKDMLVAMSEGGRVRAHILTAGGRTVAVSFGYIFRGQFDWALTAFDYELRYFRPGYLLIEELIKYLCANKVLRYNWFGYGRFYKDQWCDIRTPLHRVWMAKRSARGGIFRLVSGMERAARSNRALVEISRRLRRA